MAFIIKILTAFYFLIFATVVVGGNIKYKKNGVIKPFYISSKSKVHSKNLMLVFYDCELITSNFTNKFYS